MKKIIINSFKLITCVAIVFTSLSSYAVDCDDPYDPNPGPNCDPDINVPIDDGVYFILAAGVLIGYTLLRKNKMVDAG